VIFVIPDRIAEIAIGVLTDHWEFIHYFKPGFSKSIYLVPIVSDVSYLIGAAGFILFGHTQWFARLPERTVCSHCGDYYGSVWHYSVRVAYT